MGVGRLVSTKNWSFSFQGLCLFTIGYTKPLVIYPASVRHDMGTEDVVILQSAESWISFASHGASDTELKYVETAFFFSGVSTEYPELKVVDVEPC